MTTIFDYKEKYQPDDNDTEVKYTKGRISLYDVKKLWPVDENGIYDGSVKKWVSEKPIDAKRNLTTDLPKDCLVFFNKEAMSFFAMANNDVTGLNDLNIPKLKAILSEEEKKSFAEKKIDLDLPEKIFAGKNIEEIKKNVEILRKGYEILKPDEKNKLYPTLHRVFELTADIQLPYENYREMDNLFKNVSSVVTVPKSEEKREPVKLPTADITSSSSHGSTGWSKMTGGAVSSEIASILHLLEYNNTVNNNFVNNVLPTLKGGNLNDINWELEHFITNSQNNEKLFNTITKLAKEAMSEPLKVYLRKLRYCIARAQGISHILKNNLDLLQDKSEKSSEILQKIRHKIGKYTTDLKKKEEAAKKGITITITSS